jgi:hypothetical protein
MGRDAPMGDFTDGDGLRPAIAGLRWLVDGDVKVEVQALSYHPC